MIDPAFEPYLAQPQQTQRRQSYAPTDLGVDPVFAPYLAQPNFTTRVVNSDEVPIEEQSDESIMQQMAGTTLSGLEAFGNLFDLPGSSVRDILTGNNPLDQWATPFSADNRTTGRELLTDYGITRANDPTRWELADVGGFAAEVALDPFTWLAPTAVAKGAGKTVGQFIPKAVKTYAKNSAVGKAASKVGREFNRHFDAKVMGTKSAKGQAAARKLYDAELGGTQEAYFDLNPIIQGFAESADPAALGDKLRRHAELVGTQGYTGKLDDVEQAIYDASMNLLDGDLGELSAIGAKIKEMDDAIGYWPRSMSDQAKEAFEGISTGETRPPSLFSVFSPNWLGRQDWLKGWKRGTEHVDTVFSDGMWEDMLKDIDARGLGRDTALDEISEAIAEKYGDDIERFYTKAELGENGFPVTVDGEEVVKEVDRYREIAKRIIDVPEWNEFGVFQNNALMDLANAHIANKVKFNTIQSTYDILATPGNILKESAPTFRKSGENFVTVNDMLKNMDVDLDVGAKEIMDRIGLDSGTQAARNRFRQKLVDKDLADDLQSAWKYWDTPDEIKDLGKTWRSVTSLFKAGVLTHPARYTRDVMSAMVRNAERGMWSPKDMYTAGRVLFGQEVTGLSEIPAVRAWLEESGREVTDQNASLAVREMLGNMRASNVYQNTDTSFSGQAGKNVPKTQYHRQRVYKQMVEVFGQEEADSLIQVTDARAAWAQKNAGINADSYYRDRIGDIRAWETAKQFEQSLTGGEDVLRQGADDIFDDELDAFEAFGGKYDDELALNLDDELNLDQVTGRGADNIPPVRRAEKYPTRKVDAFYSLASKVADDLPDRAMSLDELKATLAKRGVKKDEIDWLDLDAAYDMSESGKITKEEIKSWVNFDNVELEEQIVEGNYRTASGSSNLPTSENVREINLKLKGYKLPSGHHDDSLAYVRIGDQVTPDGKKMLMLENVQSDFLQANKGQLTKGEYWKKVDDTAAEAQRAAAQIDSIDSQIRQLADKRASMFKRRAEIGSGAEKTELNRSIFDLTTEIDTLGQLKRDATAASKRLGVPLEELKLPFQKTWHELLMKRVLKYAADNGYDGIAWTPAAIQKQRWGHIVGNEGKFFDILYDEKMPKFAKKYSKKMGGTFDNVEIPNIEKPVGGPEVSVPINAPAIIFDDAARSAYKQKQPLFQGKKGAVQFDQANKATIHWFKNNADVSTAAHELGHIFRRDLADYAPELHERAVKALGVKDKGNWTRAEEEVFAEQWESYLKNGQAPNKALTGVFQQFKEWLSNIYRSLSGQPQAVNPELKRVFDDMLSEAPNARQAFGDYKSIDSLLETTVAGQRPGTASTLGQSLQELGTDFIGASPETNLNPMNVAGNAIGNAGDVRRKSQFGPVVVGDRVGRFTDDLSRLTPLLYQLRKMSPSQIDEAGGIFNAVKREMDDIQEMQISYSPRDFTRTEQALKQVFPFYSFMRGNLAYVASEMVGNRAKKGMFAPGAGLRNNVRAGRLMSGEDDGYAPQYVSETTSIPMGELPDGSRRYFAGLGLMSDDAFGLTTFNANTQLPDLQSTGLELMSRMNPMLKAPVEYFTGESLFQRSSLGGRNLEDMDPLVGRLASNVRELLGGDPLTELGGRQALPMGGVMPIGGELMEHIIANSPVSRILSTARQITDQRKWQPLELPGGIDVPFGALGLNTLTGARVTDINIPAQQAAMKDRLDEYSRENLGAKVYENVYIPKEVIADYEKTDPIKARKARVINRTKQIFKKKREEVEARNSSEE